VTVAQVLARGTISVGKSSESARADAQLLLAHAIGRQREWLIAHADSFLSAAQAERFQGLCDARATGKPVAYIIGSAWFYGREFTVNRDVLIPRPETEHLVDEAIDHIHSRIDPSLPKTLWSVLDVGIGSGAIGCSIAAELPNVVVDGTDASPAALKVAEHNARRLNVFSRCRFFLGDLATPVESRRYDVVVTNLPYVPSADIPQAPDPVSFEPREALDGGPDGLDHYRRFLATAPDLVRAGGILLMEAGPPVMDGLLALAEAAFPRADIVVCNDYAVLPRYIKVKAPGR
jgi:release factor glutamine methyltransferase